MPGFPISIPVSVYSLSIRLAEGVGGWDADANAIGEDMHMLLKCFFHTNGQATTRAVFSAASQCNVSDGDNSSSSLSPPRKRQAYDGLYSDMTTIYARYKQGLRHMWGSLDSGYALRQTLGARRILGIRHLALLYMLWQAHFFLLHFFISIVLSGILTAFQPASAINPKIHAALSLGGRVRIFCFILLNVTFFFYNALHDVCSQARSEDMAAAKLPCVVETRRWFHAKQLAEHPVLPLVGIIYGALPALVAQVSHLWTEDLVYVVARKPKVEWGNGRIPKLSIDCNV